METDNSNSESGQPQVDGKQNLNKENAKEASTRTMFLEYDRWKPGQHAISVIGKEPGDRKGKVYARIFIDFEGEPKRAKYTAKDIEGTLLFEPSDKLWELKKNIRTQATPLLQKAKLAKAMKEPGKFKDEGDIVLKEATEITSKIADEGKEFATQAKDIVLGTHTRSHELKNVRSHKVQKSKSRGR